MRYLTTLTLGWSVLGCSLSAGLGAQDPPATLAVAPVHYTLDLTPDFAAGRLAGAVSLTVRNRGTTPVDRIPLQVYRLMAVDSVHDAWGRSLETQQRVVSFVEFPQLQVNQVMVRLHTPLPASDTTTITLRYGGYLLGYAETGMRYVQDRIDPAFTILRTDAWAFPQVGYPSFATNRSAPFPTFTYVARVTVPDSLVVANGGTLVDRHQRGDRVTWVYRSLRPSWRLDLAIAPYRTLEAGPVRIFYLPGDSLGAAGVQRAAQGSLELFASWFGPLHGTSALTILEIPDGWGSQADVTTIIQTAAAFRDSTRHYEVYHEVSHLWNPPALDTPSPRWNEGLAEFLEQAATEEINGRLSRDARANRLIEWLAERLPDQPRWREVPMVEYGTAQLTDLSYSVGALLFDLLYRALGHERFVAVVGEYYQRHAETGGTTDQFVTLVRGEGGDAVEPILRDWMLTTAWTERVPDAASIQALSEHYAAR